MRLRPSDSADISLISVGIQTCKDLTKVHLLIKVSFDDVAATESFVGAQGCAMPEC